MLNAGLLIAEIFSRYYPNQINSEGFYTGTSTIQKYANWNHLSVFFKNNGINIPKEAIDSIMNSKNDAAVLFVENLYTLLTGLEVVRNEPVEYGKTAHYAMPNSSWLIKSIGDSKKETALLVVEAHKQYLDQVRRERKALNKSQPKLKKDANAPKLIEIKQSC